MLWGFFISKSAQARLPALLDMKKPAAISGGVGFRTVVVYPPHRITDRREVILRSLLKRITDRREVIPRSLLKRITDRREVILLARTFGYEKTSRHFRRRRVSDGCSLFPPQDHRQQGGNPAKFTKKDHRPQGGNPAKFTKGTPTNGRLSCEVY